jgi:hypothetical protein
MVIIMWSPVYGAEWSLKAQVSAGHARTPAPIGVGRGHDPTRRESNMSHGTPWSSCSVPFPNGQYCERAAVPDAPFPICVRHLTHAYEFIRGAVEEADRDETMIEAVASYGSDAGRMLEPRQTDDMRRLRYGKGPVVYYLRVGGLIKIGHTKNLEQRRLAYPIDHELLAVECGGFWLERQRHMQFGEDIDHGREWFLPSAALISHINTLRSTPLTATDLAA